MKDIKLFWMPYKLFPYERVLGKREVESLLQPKEIMEDSNYLLAQGCQYPEKAEHLVYFSAYCLDEATCYTLQYEREHNGDKKQNTRYFAHGIHEYKGKFNPQIVRTIMNICGADSNSLILDPFCGSGTSLLEAQLQGCEAYGIDINPMAVFIAKTKTNIVFHQEEIAAFDIDRFIINVQQHIPIPHIDDARSKYLKNWFLEDIYEFIESWRVEASEVGCDNLRDLLLLSLSNVLRDYSEQEPSDLRVRRRNSPYPEEPIDEAAKKSFLKCQARISQFYIDRPSIAYKYAQVINKSSSTNNFDWLPHFDLAVTSPPYATALPYIDTQRLSIVWLGLDSPQNIKALECSLTGSRETMRKREQQKWLFAMSKNTKGLCEPVTSFCQTLQQKLTPQDGFRKQHTPFLLYKYFAEMSLMFNRIHGLLKAGAYYCLVVGYNKTNIGGPQLIDTPLLLAEEAKMQGFHVEEIVPLETYQRYGLHAKQAITGEALIILRA